jgi:hypothetical protein
VAFFSLFFVVDIALLLLSLGYLFNVDGVPGKKKLLLSSAIPAKALYQAKKAPSRAKSPPAFINFTIVTMLTLKSTLAFFSLFFVVDIALLLLSLGYLHRDYRCENEPALSRKVSFLFPFFLSGITYEEIQRQRMI